MSARFGVCSWLSRLADPRACIVGGPCSMWLSPYGRNDKEYYALAEDRRGNHYPYPKLPRPLRFAFRAAVVWHNRHGIRHPVRGRDWFFRWPCCGAKSSFAPGGYMNVQCPMGCGPYHKPYIALRPWQMVWWWESFPGKARLWWWWHVARRIERIRGIRHAWRRWTDNGDLPF